MSGAHELGRHAPPRKQWGNAKENPNGPFHTRELGMPAVSIEGVAHFGKEAESPHVGV